jgi:hypothetical protein
MSQGNQQPSVEITPEGGLAAWYENQTGGASVKGQLVEPSTTTDLAVQTIATDEPDPIGVIYDGGVANGGMIRIVFSGRAEVLFGNTPIRHNFARNNIASDLVNPGEAVSETLPTPPFATDKHFLEVGHVLETKGAPGLALVNLHFN